MQKTLNEFYDNVDLVEVYPESREYLEKYWLAEEEYVSHWQPLQARIFDSKVDFVSVGRIFLPEFKLMSFLGGSTFCEKDLLLLQACMRELGDEYFVVIQNIAVSCEVYEAYKAAYRKEKEQLLGPRLKFKYPVNIEWEEIATGDFPTDFMLCVVGCREFYVFGESGLWGKYAANDYVAWDIYPPGGPLDILGFKASCAELFQKTFHNCMTKPQKRTTREFLTSPSLHPAYKEYKEHLY
jgi:hypothetical protein